MRKKEKLDQQINLEKKQHKLNRWIAWSQILSSVVAAIALIYSIIIAQKNFQYVDQNLKYVIHQTSLQDLSYNQAKQDRRNDSLSTANAFKYQDSINHYHDSISRYNEIENKRRDKSQLEALEIQNKIAEQQYQFQLRLNKDQLLANRALISINNIKKDSTLTINGFPSPEINFYVVNSGKRNCIFVEYNTAIFSSQDFLLISHSDKSCIIRNLAPSESGIGFYLPKFRNKIFNTNDYYFCIDLKYKDDLLEDTIFHERHAYHYYNLRGNFGFQSCTEQEDQIIAANYKEVSK